MLKDLQSRYREDCHFHSLKYTALTRLFEKTKDIRLVQEVAGHSDISTTMVYTHISGADIREAMINL